MPDRTMFLWDEPGISRGGPSPPALAGLEARIGAPRETWAIEDVVGFCRQHGVRSVSLLHVGGDGRLKTLDFVARSDGHLRAILQGGERADGSSLFGDLGIDPQASDIALKPRLATAFLDPFAEAPTLAVLCGHVAQDGTPLQVSPDSIVRHAWRRLLEETGVQLWALGEVEFFLGRRVLDGEVPGGDDQGYHATAPTVFGEALRRRALVLLADLGIPVKYGHAEVGAIGPKEADGWAWQQHEIELDLLPIPQAADAVVLTRWILDNLARRAGFRLSTAPVVVQGHAGNGLHFHLAPRQRGVELLGAADVDVPAGAPRWLLGGLLAHGDALMAFGNRDATSFERIQSGRETPKNITWGRSDRSALVRLPIVPRTAEGRPVAPATIEIRLPDGSAHPHLVLAGIAQAMLAARDDAALDDLIEGARAGRLDAAGLATRPLPTSFREVGEALARSRPILEAGGVVPPALLEAVLARLVHGVPIRTRRGNLLH